MLLIIGSIIVLILLRWPITFLLIVIFLVVIFLVVIFSVVFSAIYNITFFHRFYSNLYNVTVTLLKSKLNYLSSQVMITQYNNGIKQMMCRMTQQHSINLFRFWSLKNPTTSLKSFWSKNRIKLTKHIIGL